MYTVNEIAKEFGCLPCWVRHLCSTGRLNAKKVGRDWVIFDKRVAKKIKRKWKRSANQKPTAFWENGFNEMKKQRLKYEDWENRALKMASESSEE